MRAFIFETGEPVYNLAVKVFVLIVAILAPGLAQLPPKDAGPATLIIQYRCPIASRAALRRTAQSEAVAQFEKWKTSGLLAGYRLLFSRYVDNSNWDMSAVLSFRDGAAAARWKRVEALEPSGLLASAQSIVSAASTYPVDLARSADPSPPPAEPAYMVIPYSFTVTPAEYIQYFDDYVRPQLQGWSRSGVLAGYALYLQRYTAARPWDGLLVLQYKDDAALGQREKVVAQVRQELQNDAKWKAIAENKQSIRTEKEAIVADQLVPPRM
jgi:hypothetical protein